jgi:hypothetical protein
MVHDPAARMLVDFQLEHLAGSVPSLGSGKFAEF